MNCGVCGLETKDIAAKDFDGQHIRCPRCGDYEIAGSVYDNGAWDRLDSEQRKDALEKAKRNAKPGEVPLISNYEI